MSAAKAQAQSLPHSLLPRDMRQHMRWPVQSQNEQCIKPKAAKQTQGMEALGVRALQPTI